MHRKTFPLLSILNSDKVRDFERLELPLLIDLWERTTIAATLPINNDSEELTMYEKNKIRQMLAQNQIPLGMQCFTGDPILIEIMGLTGFDWVMLDSEHSGNNPRAMESLIRAAESVGMSVGRRNAVPCCRRVIRSSAMALLDMWRESRRWFRNDYRL